MPRANLGACYSVDLIVLGGRRYFSAERAPGAFRLCFAVIVAADVPIDARPPPPQ